MDFKLNINIEEVKRQLNSSYENLEQKVRQAVAGLAAQTHAKIISLVQTNLRSTRRIYIENMYLSQVNDNLWTVGLREGGMWIEEGMEPHSMVQDLLKGRRFRVIPIDQGRAPSDTPVAMLSLQDTLKRELKKYKIPMRKIERNPDGSPKLGLLHSLDIDSKEKGPTGIPYLQGIRVYQRLNERSGKPERFVGTFRTVTREHEGQGRWFHPGLESKKFFDKAFQWAVAEWENQILPELTNNISS